MPVHFSTRCLVSVREPSCESIKIVSFATKKVNERPVVVLLELSLTVGWPPERTNFPSAAVYSPCSRHAPAVALADDDVALRQDAAQLPASRQGPKYRLGQRPSACCRGWLDQERRPKCAIRARLDPNSRSHRPPGAPCPGRPSRLATARQPSIASVRTLGIRRMGRRGFAAPRPLPRKASRKGRRPAGRPQPHGRWLQASYRRATTLSDRHRARILPARGARGRCKRRAPS